MIARLEPAELRAAPAAALALERLAERAIAREQVVIVERRRLVLDLVGGRTAARTQSWRKLRPTGER